MVADLIRDCRRHAGLTQAELARRMGTTQTAVARLERRGSNPRLSTVVRALQAAGRRLVISTEPSALPELDLAQLRSHLQMSALERAEAHDRAYEETRALVRAARPR